MATTEKKEYWTDIIRKNPSAYESKFIIHNDTEIFFVHENMIEAEKFLKQNEADYLKGLGVFLVPRDFGAVRLRLLKIRSLMTGEWTPTHVVNFMLDDGTQSPVEMIVDSGADITYLPKKVGERLGMVRSPHELILEARSVGSIVPYVFRQMTVNIDGVILTIRTIWGQDEQEEEEALLGGLDVFDHFDVLFSQKNRKVFFIPKDDGNAAVV